MSDFFADLERRLVDATTQRARRIRRARQRRAAALTAVLLALVAGGAGLAAAVGGDDAGTSAGGGPAATAPPSTTAQTVPATPGAAPRRGGLTVAVLNGTPVPGLARGVANRLQNAKFKIGNITNAAHQDRAQTEVFYAHPDDIPVATQVATAIGLGDTTLKPITKAQRIIAGAQAHVVVLVGSDQNIAAIR